MYTPVRDVTLPRSWDWSGDEYGSNPAVYRRCFAAAATAFKFSEAFEILKSLVSAVREYRGDVTPCFHCAHQKRAYGGGAEGRNIDLALRAAPVTGACFSFRVLRHVRK